MHITVIGGAGLRVPLLVRGLANSRLPIQEIRLYDTDHARLQLIATVAEHYSKSIRVRTYANVEAALQGSSFVVLSIRPGGIEQRARDERICLEHGVIGQETIGAAGLAMALRAIGPAVAYAQLVQQVVPEAWIINFTNPVSIVTQAVTAATSARVIGICDTPSELFAEAAEFLNLVPIECHFDYFGLNHLGYLREVYYRGEPQLAHWWRSAPDQLLKVYSRPIFSAEQLKSLELLPSEYLYFYVRAHQALAHMQQAQTSRGQRLATQNAELWQALAQPGADAPQLYEAYLAARDAGYMQLETAAARQHHHGRFFQTGYDAIALKVLEGIYFNTNETIVLNVPNRGNISDLEYDDIVEVPCILGSNGPLPLHVGALPEAVRDLVLSVKAYERSAIKAGLGQSESIAAEALSQHPLVPSAALAHKLVKQMGPFW